MFYKIYRLYSTHVRFDGSINLHKPATKFVIRNIRSPFHIAYGGIQEGIYAKP